MVAKKDTSWMRAKGVGVKLWKENQTKCDAMCYGTKNGGGRTSPKKGALV